MKHTQLVPSIAYSLLVLILTFGLSFTLSFQKLLYTLSYAVIVFFLLGMLSASLVRNRILRYLISLIPILILNIIFATSNFKLFPHITPATFVLSFFAYYIGEGLTNSNREWNLIIGSAICLTAGFVGTNFWFAPKQALEQNTFVYNEKFAFSNYNLKDMEGTSVNIGQFDKHTLLLEFYFIDCVPCRIKFQSLHNLNKRFTPKDSIRIIAISSHRMDKLEKVANFAKEKNYNFLFLHDENDSIINRYKIDGFPTELIIDKNGYLREKHIGFTNEAKIKYTTYMIKKLNDY